MKATPTLLRVTREDGTSREIPAQRMMSRARRHGDDDLIDCVSRALRGERVKTWQLGGPRGIEDVTLEVAR